MQQQELVIKANNSSFRLLLTTYIDRNSGKPSSYNINLGGTKKKCLNLMISALENKGTLSWVERHEECSIEINNPQSQILILLAISIAKSINPNLQYIHLEDSSHFLCTLPEGNSHKVEMKPFYMAFHQSTWYEYYFNAHFDVNYDKYIALKANFTNPENKPRTFDFGNNSLQEQLLPLYENTSTWAEFFKAISQKYGKYKCAVIYPWIIQALAIIFENMFFYEIPKWVIDLENNQKIKPIYFESYVAKWSGGRGKVSKQKQTRKITCKHLGWKYISKQRIGYVIPYYLISNWDYDKFLKTK